MVLQRRIQLAYPRCGRGLGIPRRRRRLHQGKGLPSSREAVPSVLGPLWTSVCPEWAPLACDGGGTGEVPGIPIGDRGARVGVVRPRRARKWQLVTRGGTRQDPAGRGGRGFRVTTQITHSYGWSGQASASRPCDDVRSSRCICQCPWSQAMVTGVASPEEKPKIFKIFSSTPTPFGNFDSEIPPTGP